jgi:3-hydroxyisobutyrate dehydrogenase-like beta-hydroxyacid dehydrogenase
MAAVAVGSFAEALCLLEKSGIPLYKLREALEHHAARSPLVDLKMPAMITGDFEPRFSLKHMFKDVQIALSMAEEFGVELPEAAAFAGAAMAGIQKGWADLDFSSIARHYGYPSQDNALPESVFATARRNLVKRRRRTAEGKEEGFLFGRRS